MWKYFSLAFIFLALALFFDNSPKIFEISPRNGFSKLAVENVVKNKIKQIDTLMLKVSKDITNESYCELNKDHGTAACESLFDVNYLKNLDSKGFVLQIYQDFDLKFWSSNRVPMVLNYLDSCIQNRVIEVGNAKYITRSLTLRDKIIVGLILIRNEYQYENEFLTTDYQTDFKLDATVELHLDSISGETKIQAPDGFTLFSLTSVQASRSDKPMYYPTIIFFTLFLITFIVIVAALLSKVKIRGPSWMWLLILFVVFFIRYLMVSYPYPGNFYNLELFQSFIYGYNWSPSLGDLLFNTVLILLFSYYFYVPVGVGIAEEKDKRYFFSINSSVNLWRLVPPLNSANTYITVLLLVIIVLYFTFIETIVQGLITYSRSSFDFSRIENFNVFNLIWVLIIALLYTSLFFIAKKVISFCLRIINRVQFILLSATVATFFLLIVLLSDISFSIISFIYLIVNFLIIAHRYIRKAKFGYYTYVLLIFVASVYTEIFYYTASIEKDRDVSSVKVVTLAIEQDGLAEHLLKMLNKKIAADDILIENVTDKNHSTEALEARTKKYLQKEYFHGFWRKYNLEVKICNDKNDYFSPNSPENCEDYFNKILQNEGIGISGTNYHFINNQNGSISYLGHYNYISDKDSLPTKLYLMLNSKLVSDMLGYPELLMDNELQQEVYNIPEEFSYAKYLDDKIVTKKGDFNYSLKRPDFCNREEEIFYASHNNYDHVIYNVNERNTIVLSLPQKKILDRLIVFAYLFLIFNLMYFPKKIYEIAEKLKNHQSLFNLGFKGKILLTMISVLILSFVLVGGGTIIYDIQRYKDIHKHQILEKIESVITELEDLYPEKHMLQPDWKTGGYEYLEQILGGISQAFFIDVNLFDTEGQLMASSRPEIFSKHLTGTQMHPEAYRKMVLEYLPKYIHDENIGQMYYSSAYMPFMSRDNELLGYVNLPYFSQPGSLKKEITALVITIVNLYVVLLLLTVVIAVFLSDKVTSPLRMLQNKFQEIELGKTNEQILYKSNDEIGSLVAEYNRMVVELEHSVEMLAKSERESAWREMAKQIAHEIKNPLTPMKLSIQFLQRSWKPFTNEEEGVKFKKRMDGVAKTLTEQIDNLSNIATEFSSFAKMPKAKYEYIDIVEIVNEAVNLFSNSEEAAITFQNNGFETLTIYADKEQLSRVFINLLKNAIQAIPEEKKGLVKASVFANKKIARIKIEDNGNGVPEELKNKLFTPSFTTKSSGMGMGLAIVKNIIESVNGTIWFETEYGTGTRFFVELPLSKTKKQASG